MPPKPQSSTRRSAENSERLNDGQPEVEGEKQPDLDQSSSTAELPSDPPATEFDQSPSATLPATIAPVSSRLEKRDAPVAASSSAPRGRKRVAQPKFAGRRSQAKLQELQKAEDDRKKAEADARAAEASARARREGARRNGGRGSAFGRGRGRGGYGDGGSREPISAVASGPFGASQASAQARARRQPASSSGYQNTSNSSGAGSGSRSGTGANTRHVADDGTRVKAEIGGEISTFGGERIAEDGGYISSDEDEEEKAVLRLNVEDLGGADPTRNEADHDRFAPVRVARFAHRERALGINADGATNQEGVITVDANDTAAVSSPEQKKVKPTARETLSFHATYSDSDSEGGQRTRIKRDAEVVKSPPVSPTLEKERLSSPEAARRAKSKLKARLLSDELPPEDGLYQTRDELEEWERHRQDLNMLRDVFEESVSIANHQEHEAEPDKRANRVYLFQFPPIMPDLSPIAIKADPDAAVEAMDLTAVDEPAEPKTDADTITAEAQTKAAPNGAVGKMKVHASGRVTIDWGGTDLRMTMGAEANFLQDVLIANLPEAKSGDDEVQQVGTAMGMGRVHHKFVVTPDWEEILK